MIPFRAPCAHLNFISYNHTTRPRDDTTTTPSLSLHPRWLHNALLTAAMAERTGTKRPREESNQFTVKRRKVHHALHYVQHQPAHIEPAPQNPVFAQGQLMRSISAALTMVGFDSAKPTAIEMFRAAVEECTS